MIESPIRNDNPAPGDWLEAADQRIACARSVLTAIQCDAMGAAEGGPTMTARVHGELAWAAETLIEDAEAFLGKARGEG